MSAADDLLSNYQHIIESLTFVTGGQGIFDVEVDGTMLYSKHQTGRHIKNNDEVLDLIRAKV